MKKWLVLFIPILLLSCKLDKQNVSEKQTILGNDNSSETYFFNELLIDKLDIAIEYIDSVTSDVKTNCSFKSYWIVFYEEDDVCHIAIISNFDYYNSEKMDGYFLYRNKIITVYGSEKKCSKGFILNDSLKYGEIEELRDYASEGESIGAHEPYFFKYKIHTKDSLILSDRGG